MTGDYRDVTEPHALARLLDLRGDIAMRVFESDSALTDGLAMQRHEAEGTPVHLFVRRNKEVPGGGAAPFYYCGELAFQDWERDRLITIRRRLQNPVPDRLRRAFGLETEVVLCTSQVHAETVANRGLLEPVTCPK